MKKFFLASCFLLGILLFPCEKTCGQNQPFLLTGRKNLERIWEMLSQLELSPEQRQQLFALRQQMRQKLQSFRAEKTLSPEEIKSLREKREGWQQEFYNRFMQILTEDQRLELAVKLTGLPDDDREETIENTEELLFLLKQTTAKPALPPGFYAPYEQEDNYLPSNEIDRFVLARLKKETIPPAPLCSDEVFIRRVYLDMTGRLPAPAEVLSFIRDKQSDKRARLIENLLEHKDFVDYWAMKWADVLRIKAEFPINLWPNAAAVYHRWVCQAIRNNMPYDRFARALLTASGSNFREPPANFFRAVQSRTPSGLAEAVALTFMGTRISSWPEKDRKTLEMFFSAFGYKKTAEWKEEIVYWTREPLPVSEIIMPDGKKVYLSPEKDPREVFADWLIRKDNPWFTRAIVNRVWYWFFGRGLIQEVDDIRPDNPPVNPELLDYLAEELVKFSYDLKHLFRLILNSRTYQQSCFGRHSLSEKYFACYPLRPLEAEVLEDIFRQLFQIKVSYSSDIPEPYTYIPEQNRTITLFDGSITSPFLLTFGRPPRDTGLASERNQEPAESQRLFLINSSRLNERIRNNKMVQTFSEIVSPDSQTAALNLIWLTLLSRLPTAGEIAAINQYGQTKKNRAEVLQDIIWALINTGEFSCRH